MHPTYGVYSGYDNTKKLLREELYKKTKDPNVLSPDFHFYQGDLLRMLQTLKSGEVKNPKMKEVIEMIVTIIILFLYYLFISLV